ncbi:LysM peptidoglycan-binding domain-containing protein [Bengtsoniella intestinalis]|uniref:LysM peptidoglycan-binding domain-containing protein n=1 Tax=Bengtsoniella intestinalis TaxID=3073143 RepID=UPI00391EF5A5
MSYGLKLTTQGGSVFNFPVLPEKIQVESQGNHTTVSVIGVGEVLQLGGATLQKITFNSHFPSREAPYVSSLSNTPMDCVSFLESAQASALPLTLQLSGGALELSQTVGVENFTYYEQGGDVGDVYFSLTLRQWRLHSAKTLTLTSDSTAVEDTTATRTEPEVSSNVYYTVVSGDCLWNIAKSHYGDATRWSDIYAANKEVVGSNPNLIYPGQELLLP